MCNDHGRGTVQVHAVARFHLSGVHMHRVMTRLVELIKHHGGTVRLDVDGVLPGRLTFPTASTTQDLEVIGVKMQ